MHGPSSAPGTAHIRDANAVGCAQHALASGVIMRPSRATRKSARSERAFSTSPVASGARGAGKDHAPAHHLYVRCRVEGRERAGGSSGASPTARPWHDVYANSPRCGADRETSNDSSSRPRSTPRSRCFSPTTSPMRSRQPRRSGSSARGSALPDMLDRSSTLPIEWAGGPRGGGAAAGRPAAVRPIHDGDLSDGSLQSAACAP